MTPGVSLAGEGWPGCHWDPRPTAWYPRLWPRAACEVGMQRLSRLPGKRLLSQMARRPELLCGAIVLSCALIIALRISSSRAKDTTMPAKPPVNFFPSMSPVVDLYRGELDYAEHMRQDSEITLFFLYAPWCGQSIAAREEVEEVASKLADQVLFVAVNCWWNQGKCRKERNFFYFPVIHLYHRSFGPIEYKGPMAAVYIEKFVRRVMTPLLYIPSRARLLDFISNYEPGVLGYFEFNASPQPPGYLTFFSSALHSLKKDYISTIRFGVITDKHIAKEISLTDPGSVYLHRNLNKSLVYPHQVMNFTAPNICVWALENRETILQWLRPHGGKSLLLNNELKKGPALIFFIPFNPLLENQPLLDDITEVALKYSNCNKSQVTDYVLQHLMDTDPPTLEPFAPDSTAHMTKDLKYPCCNTVLFPQWHSISRTHNVCELCINQTVGVKPSKVNMPQCNFFEIETALNSYLGEQVFMQIKSSTVECSNFLSFYSPFNHYTACCRTVNRSMITSKFSAQDILQTLDLAFSSHGKDRKEVLVPHIEESSSVDASISLNINNITGLKCRTNRTLNLYLIDSNLFWNYAESLGASKSNPVKEFAAIVDLKEELHYILQEKQELMKHAIETFIQNFSTQYSPLRRHLVGSSPIHQADQCLISEVTTATFSRIVLWNTKDVILLYYAPWCGFCTALNHMFIRLARLLPADYFIVARINVARNDLPWEFMVDYLPTILLFPHRRKDKSMKFPEDMEITVPNLLRFIFQYSTPSVDDPSELGPKQCLQNQDPPEQGKVSHLENEIQRLRAEIGALRQVQDNLAVQISEARKDEHKLKIQKQTLEENNQALLLHKNHLQALYEYQTKQLGEIAEKLEELADASENLLTENALLKLLVASMEETLSNNKADNNEYQASSDETRPVLDDVQRQVLEKETLEGSNLEGTVTSEHINENRTG